MPAVESFIQRPARYSPSADFAGVITEEVSTSPRLSESVTAFPPLSRISAPNSSTLPASFPSTRSMTSPTAIPASRAGDTRPVGVSTSVIPTTTTPSVKNFTPNGIPPGISVGRVPAAAAGVPSTPYGRTVHIHTSRASITANALIFLFTFIEYLPFLSCDTYNLHRKRRKYVTCGIVNKNKKQAAEAML